MPIFVFVSFSENDVLAQAKYFNELLNLNSNNTQIWPCSILVLGKKMWYRKIYDTALKRKANCQGIKYYYCVLVMVQNI